MDVKNLDSLKKKSFKLLQSSAWLRAFCKEMMSVGLDMILKHLVSSANRDSSTILERDLLIHTHCLLDPTG